MLPRRCDKRLSPIRRIYAIACAVAITALAMIPAAAPGGGSAPTGFTLYTACSPDGERHSGPTHICQQGDAIRAVLRYGAAVDYKVCLRFGKGPVTCGDTRHLNAGTASVANLPSKDFTGLVTVSWRVGSEEVGSSAVRFVSDPIVPSFGVSPLIVAGTHRLFGLIVRHVPVGLRVRAWRVCERGCPLPLKLVSQDGESRRYRITGARKNSAFSLGDLLFVLVDAPGRTKGSQLWGRLYRGKLIRDPKGSPADTAIHQMDPPLCSPPGLPFGFSKDCRDVRSPQAPLADSP